VQADIAHANDAAKPDIVMAQLKSKGALKEASIARGRNDIELNKESPPRTQYRPLAVEGIQAEGLTHPVKITAQKTRAARARLQRRDDSDHVDAMDDDVDHACGAPPCGSPNITQSSAVASIPLPRRRAAR
jgi:hypothetical protein